MIKPINNININVLAFNERNQVIKKEIAQLEPTINKGIKDLHEICDRYNKQAVIDPLDGEFVLTFGATIYKYQLKLASLKNELAENLSKIKL